MWLKYKSNGAIINKLKMLKKFNYLDLHIRIFPQSSSSSSIIIRCQIIDRYQYTVKSAINIRSSSKSE